MLKIHYIKILSNFWRSPDLPLINCKIEFDLSQPRNCLSSEIPRAFAVAGNPGANPPISAREATLTIGA